MMLSLGSRGNNAPECRCGLTLTRVMAVCNNKLCLYRYRDPCVPEGEEQREQFSVHYSLNLLAKVLWICPFEWGTWMGVTLRMPPESEHQCYAFRRVTMAITQFFWCPFQILFSKDQLEEHVLCPPRFGKGTFGRRQVCEASWTCFKRHTWVNFSTLVVPEPLQRV